MVVVVDIMVCVCQPDMDAAVSGAEVPRDVQLDGRLGTIITLVIGRGNESSGMRFRTRCQLHSNLHN